MAGQRVSLLRIGMRLWFGQNARRLAKNLAREPQGEVECALVMQMAFTHRSEKILTNEEMTDWQMYQNGNPRNVTGLERLAQDTGPQSWAIACTVTPLQRSTTPASSS
jgi:hypothetical protein